MPYFFYLNELSLPVPPKKMDVKINNKNTTIELINEGEINLIKKAGLTEISFEILLPRYKYPFAVYESGFKPPAYYLSEIEKLKLANKPFRFLVARYPRKSMSILTSAKSVVSSASEAGVLAVFDILSTIFPASGVGAKQAIWEDTNMLVTLENYTLIEDASSNGDDYMVSIKLKQWKNYGTQKLIPPARKGTQIYAKVSVKGARATSTTKKEETSYTVKSGDNLPVIAKKYLGSASKSKELYNLNKTVIEAAAKKNGRKSSSSGHWIYPGTKLKLK